jgi:hypothetical protein
MFRKMATRHMRGVTPVVTLLHCYGLVLAKVREENPYLQCCQPET